MVNKSNCCASYLYFHRNVKIMRLDCRFTLSCVVCQFFLIENGFWPSCACLRRKLKRPNKRSEPHGTTCHSPNHIDNRLCSKPNHAKTFCLVQCDTRPPFPHHSTPNPHRHSVPRRPRATMARCRDRCRRVQTRTRPVFPIKPSPSSMRRSRRHKAVFTRPRPHWRRQTMGRRRRRRLSGPTHPSTNKRSAINNTKAPIHRRRRPRPPRHYNRITLTINWRIPSHINKSNIIERQPLPLVRLITFVFKFLKTKIKVSHNTDANVTVDHNNTQ